MSRYTGLLAGAAFALYAATGVAAFAQPGPPAPGPEHMGHMMRHAEHRDPAPHLRAILQLKPAQEPALAAFLAAVKPEHEPMGPMADMHHGPGAKTTPERLAELDRHMTEHVAAMHIRMDATRRFYEQLDPAQKRAFDELPMMMMGDHEHMGHMKGMMRHPPKPPGPPPAPHA